MEVEKKLTASTVLNLDILTQYTQAIGGQVLLGSVDIFSQQYPKYINDLIAFHDAGDTKSVAEQGHKMKGAAGAIGLARLGDWAQYIQSNEAQDWQVNYPKFIAKIEQNYQQDIATLRTYLENA